jgi:hypothetical protein
MKVGQRVQWNSLQNPGRVFKGIVRRIESEYSDMAYTLLMIPGRIPLRSMSFVAVPVLENTWAIVEDDIQHKLEPIKLCRLSTIVPPTHKNAKGGGSAPPGRSVVILGAQAA